jgi:hypothetical protein
VTEPQDQPDQGLAATDDQRVLLSSVSQADPLLKDVRDEADAPGEAVEACDNDPRILALSQ